MKRVTMLLAIVPFLSFVASASAQVSLAAPGQEIQPELISPLAAAPTRAASAPLADPYYNHGIPWGIHCCEATDPCAAGLWDNYCATKVRWCERARRCDRGCDRGCCPDLPAACDYPVHGCESGAGSMPCCSATIDRLHMSPGCSTCSAPRPRLFDGLFGGLKSCCLTPGCATCEAAPCNSCEGVQTNEYYQPEAAPASIPAAAPAPADHDLGVPPKTGRAVRRLPNYLRGY